MFVYVCFLVRYYYVECIDFMYDSIKILYIYIYSNIIMSLTTYSSISAIDHDSGTSN